jgi:predicted O-methyltransferase YrrM
MNPYWEKQMAHDGTRSYFETMSKIVAELKPKSVLEIGTGWGISGTAFLENGVNDYTTIDPNLDAEYGRLAVGQIKSVAKAGQNIEFINGRAENICPGMIAAGKKFDLVYIDGDHGYKGCVRDIWYAVELAKKEILLDDFLHAQNLDPREGYEYGIVRACREYLLKTGNRARIIPNKTNGFIILNA